MPRHLPILLGQQAYNEPFHLQRDDHQQLLRGIAFHSTLGQKKKKKPKVTLNPQSHPGAPSFQRLGFVIYLMGYSCWPCVTGTRIRGAAWSMLSGVWPAVNTPWKPVLMHQEINWQVLAGRLLCAQHCIRSVATGPPNQPSRAHKVWPKS